MSPVIGGRPPAGHPLFSALAPKGIQTPMFQGDVSKQTIDASRATTSKFLGCISGIITAPFHWISSIFQHITGAVSSVFSSIGGMF